VSPARPLAYLYGVAEGPAPADLPAVEAILPGVAIEAHARAGLVAFASPVGEDEFGGRSLEAADPAWLTDRVIAHARVLAALMPRRTIVPLRFGTVCRDPGEIGDFIERQQTVLVDALDHVRGATEWGVKLHCDPDVLGAAVERELPAARMALAARAAATPGRGFFLAKRIAPIVAAETAARVAACVERTNRSLAAAARASVPLRSAALSAEFAYLVADDRLAAFRERLAELGTAFAASGVRYEMSGPWPPYNFVAGGGAVIERAADGR